MDEYGILKYMEIKPLQSARLLAGVTHLFLEFRKNMSDNLIPVVFCVVLGQFPRRTQYPIFAFIYSRGIR